MYATNYFETAFLNTMRGITLSAPSKLYIGLFISNPGDEGAGTEITYQGYARQPITFTTPAKDSDLSAIAIKNDLEITFPTSPTDAGTVTHIGILDSAVGGNMWLYGEAREGLIINAREAPVVLAQEVIYYSTGNLSGLYKTALLNVFRRQSIAGYTPHLALFSGSPEAGGAEISGENYARVPLTMGAPAEQDSGQMLTSNAAAVKFPRPSTAWGMWDYTAIYDAASGGKPVWIIEKLPAKDLRKGCMPCVAAGEIKAVVN